MQRWPKPCGQDWLLESRDVLRLRTCLMREPALRFHSFYHTSILQSIPCWWHEFSCDWVTHDIDEMVAHRVSTQLCVVRWKRITDLEELRSYSQPLCVSLIVSVQYCNVWHANDVSVHHIELLTILMQRWPKPCGQDWSLESRDVLRLRTCLMGEPALRFHYFYHTSILQSITC